MSGLSTVPVIYSRVRAVFGAVYWLLGFLCLLGFLYYAVYFFGGSIPREWLTATLFTPAIAGLMILGHNPAFLEFMKVRDFVKGMFRERRPRWIFGVCCIAFLIYPGILTVWAVFAGMAGDVPRPGRILLFLLMVLFISAVATPLTEFYFRVGTLVWRQLRGWGRLPFDGWTEDQLHKIVSVGRKGRWLDPRTTKMSLDEVQAYSWLAESGRDQCGMFGQLLVLLGGGGVGAGVSFWISTAETWPLFVVGASALVGIMGYMFTHIAVGELTKRVNTYDAYIASVRLAATHGRRVTPNCRRRNEWLQGSGAHEVHAPERRQQPEAVAPTETVAKPLGFLRRMRGRMHGRKAQAAEGESPSE